MLGCVALWTQMVEPTFLYMYPYVLSAAINEHFFFSYICISSCIQETNLETCYHLGMGSVAWLRPVTFTNEGQYVMYLPLNCRYIQYGGWFDFRLLLRFPLILTNNVRCSWCKHHILTNYGWKYACKESSLCELCGCYEFKSRNWKQGRVTLAPSEVHVY